MLTRRQKRHFYEEGYVVVPGAVPRLMVDAARQAINHSVGSVGVREENSAQYRPAALCDELRSQARRIH